MKNTILGFLPPSVSECEESDRICERTSRGFFISTTPQPTLHWWLKHFLDKHGIPVLIHPPYSPDLAPCDYFMLPKLKEALKGIRFVTVEAVKQKATTMNIVSENVLKHCIELWKVRMEKCRDSGWRVL